MKLSRLRKTILWISGILLITVVVLIIFISPLAKYLVEKYDEKILGRQIEIGVAYVNPFTGYIYFSNVKIYEAKSDSVFLHTRGLSANFTVYQLFRGIYEISEIKLNQPVANFILQGDSTMNLDDIVERFTSKDSIPDPNKKKVQFSIKTIIINDGEFHYQDQVIPVNYFIKKVNIVSTGFQWDSDTTRAKYDFIPGNGKGEAKGDLTINTANQDYRFATVLKKYDLKFLEQYMLDVAEYGNFDADIDADVKATGNFKDAEKLDARGIIGINKFRFGKDEGEDYASFDKFVLDIKQLNPAQHIYNFDSAILTKPYLKYERYDYLDNYSNMFGIGGENVTSAKYSSRFNLIFEVADYVAELSKNFFKSNYKVNKIAIINGDLRYSDYALNEKFSADLSPLYVFADSIAKTKDRVRLSLRSGIKPYGNVDIFVSINPRDSSDFDMNYRIDKISTASLNPYLITYTSFPMDRGTIEFSGTWHVRNGMIQSDNHILVLDPRLGNRIKKKDAQRLPLPLIMYFVRERANVIDYNIPVTGNLSDPKFHLRDVILDILSNIFAKPPTIPYRIKVRQVENEIEKSLTLKWDVRQAHILNEQEKFMDRMADFLHDNPDASINIYPQLYESKEKEYILFYEAKKKYFLQVNEMKESEFTMEDSIRVEKMPIKDSFFVRHLNKVLKNKMLFTIQDKCTEFLGKNVVNKEYTKLAKSREASFMNYFRARGVLGKIKFYNGTDHIPYNGFSFYRIEYKGELPFSLYKAYSKMNDLDDSPPRRRFKKERRKGKSQSSIPIP